MYIICFIRIYVHSTDILWPQLCQQVHTNVIVIDKPTGLGSINDTCEAVFVSYLCTIYHQNKRFETIKTCHNILVVDYHKLIFFDLSYFNLRPDTTYLYLNRMLP